MATATPEVHESEPSPARLFRISLEMYKQMGESGLLSPHDRVELLDGLLVTKMPKGPRHVLVTIVAFKLRLRLIPEEFHPRFEAPVELRRGPQGDSAPEPDLTVVRGSELDYSDRHPIASDVLLVFEVADNSVAADRKGLRRYAWFGIPTTWIINLRERTVEVYTGPSGPSERPGYANGVTRTVGEFLEIALDDQMVEGFAVADFLPWAEPPVIEG